MSGFGGNYVRPTFKIIKSIIAERFASTSANAIDSTTFVPQGHPLTVHCSTGYVWIKPNSTSVTTSDGFKMYEGMTLDIGSANNIAITSDSTTAKIQGIIWE